MKRQVEKMSPTKRRSARVVWAVTDRVHEGGWRREESEGSVDKGSWVLMYGEGNEIGGRREERAREGRTEGRMH